MNNHAYQPYQTEEPPPPPPRPVTVSLPASTPVVTYAILALTVFFFLLQIASDFLFQVDLPLLLGAKSSDLIRAGQLWRLITPVLLHGSILHIGFNMYALVIFGTGLERRFGHGRFLLLYLLGGFAGNVLSFLFSSGVSVGASTAVFGLVAAEGLSLYQNRALLGSRVRHAIGNVIVVVMFNLFLGFSSGGMIDNWGHIGGLLGGLTFTSFGGPLWQVEGVYPALRLADRREPRHVILGVALVMAFFGALAAWGMLYPLTP